MKQARIVETPPRTPQTTGYWYTLETLDGQPLRHAFAPGVIRTGGAPQADPDKRAEAIGKLRALARENGFEIVEGQPS